jgi:DNA-binding response OmpR family regulator
MKVLVVEDEWLVGMDLVLLLQEWGHVTSGPHSTPRDALEAIKAFDPDLALLDVNLGRHRNSLAIAEVLVECDTPFAYITGYGSRREAAVGAIEGVLKIRKPVMDRELKKFIAKHDPGNV